MDVFENIRDKNIIDYGQKFEEWAPRILVDQYSDRTHFIFELLQNAEDAEASEISIQLFYDKLVLCHDGREFNENDVRGICGVSASTKREASNRIGRFGIGFKSVYAYTDIPHIISGKYDFIIKNLIMPYPTESRQYSSQTIFELPFQEKSKDSAFSEISAALKKNLVPDSMLTLSHIKKIEFSIEGINGHRVLTKTVRLLGRGIQDITLSEIFDGSTPMKTKLLAFVSSDEKPTMIAYKIGEASNSEKVILPVVNSYLYAFFPTAIETHQSFYIHAPFDTTPARDNIKRNEYNNKLVSSIASLFIQSVMWMRDRRYITLKFYNQVYPLYAFSEDALLYPLYTAGVDLISSDADILPTNLPNIYGNIENTFIPESQNIVQCFDDGMLAQIYDNRNIHWMEKTIASEMSRSFREYLQSNFSIKQIGWKNLVSQLTAGVLETKTDAWLIALMRNIQPYCFSERSEDRINAKDIPLVRLENGKHFPANNSAGKFQVYINNPEGCNKKISESILADSFARNFYLRILEIPVYDIFEEIKNDILPLYEDAKRPVTFAQNIVHLRIILKALHENSERTISLVSLKLILLTNKGWTAPKDTYLPESYFKSHSSEYALLSELRLNWLSEQYKGKISVDELVELGCHSSIEPVELSEEAYARLLRENENSIYQKFQSLYVGKTYHSSRDGFSYRRSIAKLPENLSVLGVEASIALAEVISHNLSIYKLEGTIVAANDAAFRGKSLVSIDAIPSAIGLILNHSAWIYDKKGEHNKLIGELRRSEIHPDYERRASALMDILPFVHENNIVRELIGHYDPRYQTFLSELLSNQAALSEAFDSYKRSKTNKNKVQEVSESSLSDADISTQEVTGVSSDDETEEQIIGEIVNEIVHNTARRRRKSSGTGTTIFGKNEGNVEPSEEVETPEDIDEDEYTKAPVDYAKKIEQAKQRSAGEIDKIARYEYLHRLALTYPKYSYGWFTTLLELEALNSTENSTNSKEISISFGGVELEKGTSRTLVLKQPSRYIPQYMEDLADIPLVMECNGQTKIVAIEVVNVQSYSLRVKLKANADIDGIDLDKVQEARINAQNPGFLLEALRKRFSELRLSKDFDMQISLPDNLEFIFGPPGTGKTTYLAQNILLPIMQHDKARVLVLTPTNKAADVLTSRIIEKASNQDYLNWLVRFGVTNDASLETCEVFRDKTFDIRTLEKSVTVTTIARFAYDYFMPQGERLYLYDMNWDYIIIDEASMISLAYIVYPIYKKTPKKFIIAGDPFQIAPIASVDIWKDESIYTMVKLHSFAKPKTFPKQYPVTLLTTQYRSIPSVGEIFSKFAYDGILKHYRSEQSQRKLNIEDKIGIGTLNIIKYPVSKYESIYRAKTLAHKSPYHIYSALFSYEFVCYLAEAIVKANPEEAYRVGIIAPYRAQADLIEKLVSSAAIPQNINVGVGTIHGFQGDECDIVIVVLNTPPSISSSKDMFLNKRNILNVAISRARDYLFVIMPDDETENIENLHLVKQVERLMTYSKAFTEYKSQYIENVLFQNEHYLEENSFATSHQNVNVYGRPEKKYEIRSEDTAVDIQVHDA